MNGMVSMTMLACTLVPQSVQLMDSEGRSLVDLSVKLEQSWAAQMAVRSVSSLVALKDYSMVVMMVQKMADCWATASALWLLSACWSVEWTVRLSVLQWA